MSASYVVVACHSGRVHADGCDLRTAQRWARGYSLAYASAVAQLAPGETAYSESGPDFRRRESIGLRITRA